MTSPYQLLAERIQGEVLELDRVVQRSLTGWARSRQMPEEDMYLDGVALNLHSFYSGIERLFELVAQRIDHNLPTGQVRALDEFRRFRHLVRNVYTMNLVPEKMSGLLMSLDEEWQLLRAELLAFADFLEGLARVGEDQDER